MYLQNNDYRLDRAAQKAVEDIDDIFANTYTFQTNLSDIELHCNYPDENPQNALNDICDALSHIGVFDGIKIDPTQVPIE